MNSSQNPLGDVECCFCRTFILAPGKSVLSSEQPEVCIDIYMIQPDGSVISVDLPEPVRGSSA